MRLGMGLRMELGMELAMGLGTWGWVQERAGGAAGRWLTLQPKEGDDCDRMAPPAHLDEPDTDLLADSTTASLEFRLSFTH